MATYSNDLRLKEITTGDEDGTWGTSTNTNLSLIADAFSLGTKNMAADANETFTMPDASADGTRSLYLKITSAVSLTATRTVTLAPNTVSKVWIIENATTGSQSITISQGSGATVTIATGTKAMVVTDGAGSGAAVFNANPTTTSGTVTSVGGTGTVNGITLTGTVTSSGNLTLGGTLSNVNLTSQVTGTLPIANGGTGQTTYTDGQLLIGNTTGNTLAKATLTAGTGVLITNGAGAITIEGTNSSLSALGNVTGSTNIDFTKGVVTATLTGNTTFVFTNVPTSGTVASVTLIVKQDATGGRTVTWPASSDYPGGVIPPATTTANAVDIWSLFTIDGGTIVYVSLAMKDAK